MIQVGVSAVRIAHAVGASVYLRFVGRGVLERCNWDGTPTVGDCAAQPAFEVRGVCDHIDVRSMQLTDPLMAYPLLIVLSPPLPQHTPPTQPPPREPQAPKATSTPSSTDDNFDDVESHELEPQTTGRRKFAGPSIIASLLDNHRGRNPMVLPYERVYGGSCSGDEDDKVEMKER